MAWSIVDCEDGAHGANGIVARTHGDICDRLAMVGRSALLRTDNGENSEANCLAPGDRD